jgi:hypothetical protein
MKPENYNFEADLSRALRHVKAARKVVPPTQKVLNGALKPTPMAVDAPAPRLSAVVDIQGPDLTAQAVAAWDARVRGEPIIDIAHQMNLSIASAKLLISEAHAAITEDLKEALDRNRQLDLARIDGLIKTYYPPARAGDGDCAQVVLKCLAQRSKLTGIEPLSTPHLSPQPQNVLVWIQNQLPMINKIVDALPVE